MIDRKNFSQANLADKQVFIELKKITEDLVNYSDSKEAFQWQRILAEKIKNEQNSPGDYEKLLVKLRWVCLQLVTEPVLLNLFEKNMDIGINQEILLMEKLKARMVILSFPGQEELKYKISRAMERSQVIFTKQGAKFEGLLAEKQTLENWLKDYRVKVIDNPREKITLIRSQYFGTDQNFVQLDQETQKTIKDIIDIYNFVNTSSLFFAGYPEDHLITWENGEVTLLENGELTTTYLPPKLRTKKTAQKGKKPQIKEEVISPNWQQAYLGDQAEEEKITDWQNKLAGQDALPILFEAINNEEKEKALAILRMLAQNKNLEKILQGSSPVNSMFQGFLQAQFGQDILEKFKQNPQQPVYLYLFLHFILTDKLNLEEGEAARQALHLANLYARAGQDQYLEMAYADEQSGQFKWAEVAKGAQGLVIKK